MGKSLSKSTIYLEKDNDKEKPHYGENKQISMDIEQRHEKHIELVTAETEFGRNIFNAYLIFKHELKDETCMLYVKTFF